MLEVLLIAFPAANLIILKFAKGNIAIKPDPTMGGYLRRKIRSAAHQLFIVDRHEYCERRVAGFEAVLQGVIVMRLCVSAVQRHGAGEFVPRRGLVQPPGFVVARGFLEGLHFQIGLPEPGRP